VRAMVLREADQKTAAEGMGRRRFGLKVPFRGSMNPRIDAVSSSEAHLL